MMSDPNNTPIAAGAFGTWLEQMRASLQGDVGSDVACGDCRGCCVSSYFIPVRPTDVQARAVIPIKLLVAAPQQPADHLMMGYRDDGTCPMLVERECSIYPHRPQTCRDYDCRIFAAASIDAGDASKWVINHRVRAWRFSYDNADDERAHAAVKAAARFVLERGHSFPSGRAPTAPSGIAVLAIKSYAVFLRDDLPQLTEREIALAIIAASRAFDADSVA
jgi:uncharacterized protein